MLGGIICHKPVVVRLSDGTITETGIVMAHGTGWCTAPEGTYTVIISATKKSGEKPRRKLVECDLFWTNEHKIVGSLYIAQTGGVAFETGAVSKTVGLREMVSRLLATQLVDTEHEISDQHACSQHLAVAALRGMLSSAAADWYRQLHDTDWHEHLVIIRHETSLNLLRGPVPFRFLSVYHKGVVTYCALDEIPALDVHIGDNVKRLRSIIEKWDE